MKKKSNWWYRDKRKGTKSSINPFNTPLTSPPLNHHVKNDSNYVETHRLVKSEILRQSHQGRLDEKARIIIQEASFIGIVNKENRAHFLSLARFSEVGYTTVKEILRLQKIALVKKYDQIESAGKLSELDQSEYELLYRAKFLDNPTVKTKPAGKENNQLNKQLNNQ